MILTTPTKNLRKRSNTNTAEPYGVTLKTQTRNSESKESEKPRNQETQKPRNRGTKRPRKPRNTETKGPRNQETQKPGEQKVRTMARCKMNAAAARTKFRHEVTALVR